MRAKKVSSQVAWSEREAKLRSAKRSAAVVVATLAALLSLSISEVLAGKQTSVDQDWTHWTAAECDAVLKAPYLQSPGWSWAPSKYILVQLRSALPVREAMLRQLQLQNEYDIMDAAQKRAFDAKHSLEIAEHEGNPILLYVETDGMYYCDVAGEPSALRGCTDGNGVARYASFSAPHHAQEVALKLGDGKLVMPIKTEALQDDTEKKKFLYSFPRLINGKQVLTANDTALSFVFGRDLEGGGRIRPLQNPKKFRVASGPRALLKRLSFPTAGMIYNGKLEY